MLGEGGIQQSIYLAKSKLLETNARAHANEAANTHFVQTVPPFLNTPNKNF